MVASFTVQEALKEEEESPGIFEYCARPSLCNNSSELHVELILLVPNTLTATKVGTSYQKR